MLQIYLNADIMLHEALEFYRFFFWNGMLYIKDTPT